MPRNPISKYPGKLAKKLPLSDGEDLSAEEVAEIQDRVALLFDYFGIPWPVSGQDEVDSWRILALALANKHVPAFQTAKRRGRRQTWDKIRLGRLYVDVQIELLKGKSERRACRNLAVIEPWCSIIQSATGEKGGNNPSRARTLQRKLKEIQHTQHPVIALVGKLKAQWPNNLTKNLQLLADRWQL